MLTSLCSRVRNRIYEHVIDDWSIGPKRGSPILPWKRGCKFRDPEWRNAAKETAALYLLSRQVYVDVVGGGLLYHFRKFFFSSPTTMLNYLWVINPRHKDAIRTIELDLHLWTYRKCFDEEPPRHCGRPFEMIASCKNLQHFSLNIKIFGAQFSVHRAPPFNWAGRGTVVSVSIKQEPLKLVTECAALRSIRGLKSFELVVTPDAPDRWTPGPLSFDEKSQERIHQAEDEIRQLVTREE
jgi:hypothetical protein